MSPAEPTIAPEMNREREQELLQRCSQRDHDAYESIVRHFEQRVFALLYALTGSVEDARDLTQDTFIRAWRRLDQYDPERAFAPWVLKDISGLSYAELSQMMRIPEGTVASRVFYARDALRRLLPELDNSVSRREISYDVTYS